MVPGLPVSVTMMIKHKPGYDPKHGDWEYAQFDPDGNITVSGNTPTQPLMHCVQAAT